MDVYWIPPKARYFECQRCSFKFLKKLTESASGIARCKNCEYPCIEYRLKGRFKTDEQVLKTLPPYQQMKYFWLKNPKAWEDNIKHRATQNISKGNTYTFMRDDAGYKTGQLPGIVEL